MKLKQLFGSLTIIDHVIWTAAILFITVSFLIFDRENFLTLAASIIGVTSIIINAKGHPLGQLLMLFFAAVYGYISFSFHYYGEMITYLGMTAPMALFSLIAQLCRGLPYIQKKCLFFAALRCKRYRAHSPLDSCFSDRQLLHIRSHLLCYVPCQRYLWIYQLAENEKKTRVRRPISQHIFYLIFNVIP